MKKGDHNTRNRSKKHPKIHPKNTSPSYLIHSPHSYCFRMKVPADLREFLGNRTELRYSLRTGSRRDAKEKARLIAGQIQKLFRQLRRKGSYMASELSEGQIQDIIKGYVRDVLEEDEQERVMSEIPVWEYAYCVWYKPITYYNTVIQFKKFIEKGSGLDFVKTVEWDK